MKQQESTLLDLKASEEGLRGFDFICKTYEDKDLEDFIISGIDRSKVSSMIYSIYRNNGIRIGFSGGKPNEISLKAYCECIKEGLKTFFVPEGAKFETVVQSEPEASNSKAKITSKPKNSKPKAMINSDSKTSQIKILKRSEPVPQSLLKPESEVLKSKFQKNKTIINLGNQNQKVLNLRL